MKTRSPAVPVSTPLGSVASWSSQTVIVFVPSVIDHIFVNLLFTTATLEVLIGTDRTAAVFVTFDKIPIRAEVSADESVTIIRVAVVWAEEAKSSRVPVVEPVFTPVELILTIELPAPNTEVVWLTNNEVEVPAVSALFTIFTVSPAEVFTPVTWRVFPPPVV